MLTADQAQAWAADCLIFEPDHLFAWESRWLARVSEMAEARRFRDCRTSSHLVAASVRSGIEHLSTRFVDIPPTGVSRLLC
jgi:hypothetical protein